MDEPTSAVDGPTERKIMDALRSRVADKGRTCLMVAHRMSTLKQCDKIVFMVEEADGAGASVGEEGTHDELMALGGRYKAFYDEMMKKEESGGDPSERGGGRGGSGRDGRGGGGRGRGGRRK